MFIIQARNYKEAEKYANFQFRFLEGNRADWSNKNKNLF